MPKTITLLEKLEKDQGLSPRTTHDFDVAREKVLVAPADLQPLDFEILRYFGGDAEADRAVDARNKARGVTAPRPAANTKAVDEAASPAAASPHGISLERATGWFLKGLEPKRKPFDREKCAAKERARCERNSRPMIVGVYDPEKFLLAWCQLEADPKGLTDEDVNQLASVGVKSDEALRAARAGYIPGGESSDKHDPLASMPVSIAMLLAAIEHHHKDRDVFAMTIRHVAREAQARITFLESRVDALEQQTGSKDIALATLKSRIDHLDARPSQQDAGIFQYSRQYKAGDGVSFDGSYWTCLRDTVGIKPGDGSGAFRLIAKRGRDGKDLR